MADNTTQNNTQNRMPDDADKSAEMNMQESPQSSSGDGMQKSLQSSVGDNVQESPQNNAGDSVPETNANGQEDRSYIAFISYRHKELDKKAAIMIQKRIENYRVPKELQAQAGGSRLGYVFRDEDELPISSSLSDSILHALDNTKFLIVICTPDLPQSKWCEQEIRYFLKTHDRNHLLAVLADGTPDVSFSPWMLHEFDEEGNITADLEPLAANIAGDDHKISRKVFQKESMRILAALIGCPFDTLWQRERRARTNRIMTAMGGALAALSIFAGVVLNKNAQITRQNVQISEQNAQITEQNEQITQHNRDLMRQASEMHVDAGYVALDEYDRKRAVAEALKALENNDPELTDKRVAGLLTEAMSLYTSKTRVTTAAAVQPMDIQAMAVTSDGKHVVTLDNAAYLRMLDLETGETIWETMTGEGVSYYRYNDCLVLAEEQKTALVSDQFSTRAVSLEDGRLLWTFVPENGGTALFALSPDGSRLAVADGVNQLQGLPEILFLDTLTGEVTGRVQIGSENSRIYSSFLNFRNSYGASFTQDGKYLLCALAEDFPEKDEEGKTGNYRYYVIDTEKGEVTRELTGKAYENSVTFFYGMDLDETTGDIFCAQFSQYSGKLRTMVWHPDDTVDVQEIEHRERGENGTITVNKMKTSFLTSSHLAVVGSQSTLFVFNLADGKLRKGIEMSGDILEAFWYNRDQEILGVMLSDGSFAAYALSHEENNFYSSAQSISTGMRTLTQAASWMDGPAFNLDEGAWIAVEEENPGTVLVTKCQTDPELITIEGQPAGSDLYDTELTISPSGETMFILYRDYNNMVTMSAFDAKPLTSRGTVTFDTEFGSLSAAALDDTHVVVGSHILCTDGTETTLENLEDGSQTAVRNQKLSGGGVLSHFISESYVDGDSVYCWIDGKAAGENGDGKVLTMPWIWGTGAGGSGILVVCGSEDDLGEKLAIRCWDSTDGSVTEITPLHDEISEMMVIPGEQTPVFVLADRKGTLTLYDAKQGTGRDLDMDYAYDEIKALSLAGKDDRYLVVLTSSERLDVIDLTENTMVYSQMIEGIFSSDFDISDRTLLCRMDEKNGQLLVIVRTGLQRECGYLLALDTSEWKEINRVKRLYEVDVENGYVFRLASSGLTAYPWRDLEALEELAKQQ